MAATKSYMDYKPNARVKDEAQRAADFLFWAASNFPGRPIPMTVIVKVAMNMDRIPQENSKRIEMFRKGLWARAKKILFEQYSRAVIYHPGLGFRATTGSEDTARTDQESKARRVRGAIDSLGKSRSIIKRGELKDSALKKRFDQLGSVHKQLTGGDIYDRLLPTGVAKKNEE